MATVKITLDRRADHMTKDGKFPLVLRIGHMSKTRDIPFNIHLLEDQFDEATGDILGIQNAVSKTKRVRKKFSDADLWIDDNEGKIRLMDIGELKDILERKFFDKQPDISVLDHAGSLFDRKARTKDFSTILLYEDSLKVLVKYRMKGQGQDDYAIIKTLFEENRQDAFKVKQEYQKYDMPIKSFDRKFAKNFYAYLNERYTSKNTINIHLRHLQAILNDAEDSYDELSGHKPLKKFKKTSKKNSPVVLTIAEIQAICSLTFEAETSKFHVQNYFIMMLFNMGMNFYDLGLLKVHQFDGVSIHYTRKKTESEGDHFVIEQTPECLDIIHYYIKGKQDHEYIFPLIPLDTPEHRIFRVKKNKSKWYCKHIKEIGDMVGIIKNLTTYTTRDTWTNRGLALNIDRTELSKGLGHSSTKVIEDHYEADIETDRLNAINKKITDAMRPS